MLEFFFGIQGTSPPVSTVSGELLLPVMGITVIVALIINIKRKTGDARTLFWIVLIIYIFALIELFFFPIPCYPSEFAAAREVSHPRLNYIPFVNILGAPAFLIVRNLLGNILVFVPLGFFVPYMVKGKEKIGKSVLVVFLSAIFVELLQFIGSFLIFQMAWKIVDIDDIIMNTIGGLMGIVCYLLFRKVRAKR
jgi:glycopeptide antibiotics resistance protein